MNRLLAAGLLCAVSACAPMTPERWTLTAGPLMVDDCGLADAGFTVVEGVYERTTRTAGVGIKWEHEADGRRHIGFKCDQKDSEFACFQAQIEQSVDTGYYGWLRGKFSSDSMAFNGTMTVVSTCEYPSCPATEDSPIGRPCRSVVAVSGSLIADRFPGACPPAGTKPEPGAPAQLTLVKGSRAEDLRVSELDESGKFREGGVLPTAPGTIGTSQTHIGAWFIVHTKSGGQLTCVGAFKVDSPQMRMVIQ